MGRKLIIWFGVLLAATFAFSPTPSFAGRRGNRGQNRNRGNRGNQNRRSDNQRRSEQQRKRHISYGIGIRCAYSRLEWRR